VGWIEPSHVLFLPIVLAAAAALWLYTASAVKQARQRRRVRRSFVLGFAAGWTVATVVHGKRRLPALGPLPARALRLAQPATVAKRLPSSLRSR
jgi:hypothetical protein